MQRIQFLYFDLGWTLIDEMPAHEIRAELTAEALRPLGIKISGGEFIRWCYEAGRRGTESPYQQALAELLAGAGHTSEVRVPYRQEEERLFAGVRETLEELCGRYRLGVIANQSGGTVERLKAFGIFELFEVVLSSTEFGVSKPDSRIFEEAERLCRCAPESIAMIGDRVDNDIRPAKRRGWRTVRVRQGLHRDRAWEGEEDRAEVEIARIEDLPGALAVLQQGWQAGAAQQRTNTR